MFTRCPSRLVAPIFIALAFGCSEPEENQSPTGPEAEPAVANVAAPLVFRQVSAGDLHTCGVASDNRAYCWGYNQSNQLGDGPGDGPEACVGAVGPFPCSSRPALVIGGLRFKQVSAGEMHSCGVTTENVAYCWGNNQDGQLGDGTTSPRPSPVAVAGGLQFKQVEAGNVHSCGVTTGNRVYCWGANSYGQLGDGTTARRLVPAAAAGGHAFKQVTTGTDGFRPFTCAITTDNRAFCWGRNNQGQLGDSTEVVRRTRPEAVSGGHLFRQVDAGDDHACAVTTSDLAFCWGNGRGGQLGNNKLILSFWPRRVNGGIAFDRVTAGQAHTCGEASDNRVYCWGGNGRGTLGDGTNTMRPTPTAVVGGLRFSQVSGGGLHTCGVATGGAAYCWGYGFFGQLGDGSSSSGAETTAPSAVSGPG